MFSSLQSKDLHNALIDAFPTMPSLEQMLLFELSKNLRAIASEGSLQDIVFELIKTANSQGWVEDLICAACNSNPGNKKMQSIVQKFILKKSNDLHTIIEERLKSEYENLEELGTGNFGITYRATIKNESKDIVIKTIKIEELYQIIKSNNQDNFKKNSQKIKKFQKEAEFLSSFLHSNIVRYQTHFMEEFKFLMINESSNKQDDRFCSICKLELLFLVMEYIEGKNLEELVSQREFPLEEAEALRYIQQIGEALTVVHSKGVLHRDIKPRNIMVRQDNNEAVLIDFGIAREFNPNVTQTHTVSFTQGYAPPEQLDPKAKRGNYTDIYGLAATLYHLLTQKHPSPALFRMTQPLDEPKKINSSISDRVNEAILWGMELEPSKRPQTVQKWFTYIFSLETPIELKPHQEVPRKSSILESVPGDNLNPKKDAIAEYSKQVEEFLADDGEISFVESEILNDLQQKLGLTEEQVRAVRDEVLKTFGIYKENLDKYRQFFTKLIDEQGYLLDKKAKAELEKLQKYYQLKDKDIAFLEKEAEQQEVEKVQQQQEAERLRQELEKAEYQGKLQRYEQELSKAVKKVYPLDEYVRKGLKNFQQSLGIKDEDVALVEQSVIAPKEAEYRRQLETERLKRQQETERLRQELEKAEYQAKLHRYEQELSKAVKKVYPLDEYVRKGLKNFQQSLGLKDEDVALVEQSVIAPKEAEYRRQKQAEYRRQKEAEQQFIKANSNDANYYNEQGISCYRLGDYQGAFEYFNQAIKLNPNVAQYYYNRGDSRRILGDYQGAIEDYNQAIKLNPNDADYYNNRGVCRRNLGDNQGGIEDYNQAIKLNPNVDQYYCNRGNPRRILGDYQGAIEDYNQAIKLNPNVADYYNNRGVCRCNLGDNQGAIEDYNQAIKLNPNDADYYNNRGVSRRNLGDNQGAIEDYNQAIKLNVDDAQYYHNRGVCRSILEDYQGAIEDLDQAIRINPNNARHYANKGQIYHNQSNRKNAILNYEKASSIYLNEGNYEEYQAIRDKIKKLNSPLWWL
ncbi:tetratricopeptide repeat protein [Desmonostoc muscorum CCALA 125]|nr:tetratricopeptide repeat protein [Desmonostoc muscorum CCALA 125]